LELQRVVITGRGAVSPFGQGVNTLLTAVGANRSGVVLMPDWRNIRGLESHLAAPVPAMDVKSMLPRAARRTMGPMALYATLACQEAIAEAGISPEMLDSGQVGVAIGSTTGSPEVYEQFYRDYLPTRSIEELRSGIFFKIMGHSCAANVCLALGIKGEQWAPTSACASSSQAIGLGYLLIKNGRQTAVLCGGADEVHDTVTMIFDVVKAASHKTELPLATPSPFDRDRDGVVCGAGSGILVLESLKSARQRGAHIFAEITGFGHVTDSNHIANPGEAAITQAMRNALHEAGLNAADIDYLNAHATGTQLGDIAEARGIAAVVGNQVPVSSLKGHIGHTLGAAGSLETIILLDMLARQEIIPTRNLKNPDPECLVAKLITEPTRKPLEAVLKNNFALGGVNTSLALKRTIN